MTARELSLIFDEMVTDYGDKPVKLADGSVITGVQFTPAKDDFRIVVEEEPCG